MSTYPILLVHGAGERDHWPFKRWGKKTPQLLQSNGFAVFFGLQDAWGTVDNNAQQLKSRVTQILQRTGEERIHIISHSKGGLDARRMIQLDMHPYVASLTTISTPHYGMNYLNKLLKLPKAAWHTCNFFVQLFYRAFGDRKPDWYKVCQQFETQYMKQFNHNNPVHPAVYYQSFGLVSHKGTFVKYIAKTDGINDGTVPLASSMWHNYQGLLCLDQKSTHSWILSRGKTKINCPSLAILEIAQDLAVRFAKNKPPASHVCRT